MKLRDKFLSSPKVLNKPFESDAELVQLKKQILALTTDSIVEEIDVGLYENPFLIGWMAVVSNLSDLAAVGADPIGLLIQESIPKEQSAEYTNDLQEGISSACIEHDTFILGGDTNQGNSLEIGATAVGTISNGPLITRKGANPGDILYVSNKLGVGNAYAFQKLNSDPQKKIAYQPFARIKEGSIIRKFGSACIDTSDGFFPAVATMMGINSSGIDIQLPFKQFIECNSAGVMVDYQLPIWFLLSGPHGEFELLFTIPANKNEEFLHSAHRISWYPIKVGTIQGSYAFTYLNKNLDPFKISNLFSESENDIEKYIKSLKLLDKQWQLSV